MTSASTISGMMAPYVEGVEPLDKFQLAYRRGARCRGGRRHRGVRGAPEEWGYPGPASRDALLEFNRQCEAGTPSRAGGSTLRPWSTPPYYVIEVIPAITFTFGGLRIDPQARVLDESGEPISGLLAAGADAGGVFHRALCRRSRLRAGVRVAGRGHGHGHGCRSARGDGAARRFHVDRVTMTAEAPSARVRVGIVLREQDISAWSGRLREVAERAVAAGLDHLTVGDHVSFADGHGADGLIQAAALLAAHPHVTVQTGVYLLPLRHPAIVARQLATIAQLAPGEVHVRRRRGRR